MNPETINTAREVATRGVVEGRNWQASSMVLAADASAYVPVSREVYVTIAGMTGIPTFPIVAAHPERGAFYVDPNGFLQSVLDIIDEGIYGIAVWSVTPGDDPDDAYNAARERADAAFDRLLAARKDGAR